MCEAKFHTCPEQKKKDKVYYKYILHEYVTKQK